MSEHQPDPTLIILQAFEEVREAAYLDGYLKACNEILKILKRSSR